MEEQATARDAAGRAKCSAATLRGRYLFGGEHVDITGGARVPFAVAGYEVYDGKGNVNGVASTNFNGAITRNAPFSGTYTVNADCTGTATYADGSQYDLFLAPDGSMFTVVQTHPPEGVASGFELRATAKRGED